MRYRHIIFDFDGVLAGTNEIRLEGFRLLFSRYPTRALQKFTSYLRKNSGLSRYEKIRYFFKEIQHEDISSRQLKSLARRYSKLVIQKVITAPSVDGSLEFLRLQKDNYNFAIVSSSEEKELKKVCRLRGIDHFFVEMLGSPTSKEENLANLLLRNRWKKENCIFVGDSVSDLNAAKMNGIDFIGFDSGAIDWNTTKDVSVVNDFSQLSLYLK